MSVAKRDIGCRAVAYSGCHNWGADAHLEREIKLLGTADLLDEVQRSALIRTYATAPSSTRSLHNIYYDTPGRWLAAHALTLRVRSDGKKFVQGLKSRIEAHNGLFRRWEIESEITCYSPDITLLKAVIAPPPPSYGFSDIAPIFETRFTRTQVDVETAAGGSGDFSRIAVAFDAGTLVAGEHSEAIAEIELELISGPEAALRSLAANLVETYPLQYGQASKAERGYLSLPNTSSALNSLRLAGKPERNGKVFPDTASCRCIGPEVPG